MATATDISTKALKRLGLVNSGESPGASDIAFCNDALSTLIASWDCGAFVGEVLPLAARFERAVISVLAVDVAEAFGVSPGPILMRDAMRGEQQLNAAFVPIPAAQIDHALLMLPSNCPVDFTKTTDRLPEWDGSADYRPGDRVWNGLYIYLCTQGGVSAVSGGPAGTASGITDGTVEWQFERVFGG